MKNTVKRVILALLALSVLLAFAGCSKTPEATEPVEIEWVKYNAAGDAPFLPKDIYSQELYVSGLELDAEQGAFLVTDKTDVGAIVLQGEYGKCYEVKIPAGVPSAVAATFNYDPRQAALGEALTYYDNSLLCEKLEVTQEVSFMYTCRYQEEYLVICTGSTDPVYIGQRSILEAEDTPDQWYIPDPVGGIGRETTLGDVNWTSEEVLNHFYEPLREKYPDYITRTNIGKDATGTYDMYGYVYTPKNYEITMFITGGMHADEEIAYFSLAKIMQMISDAKPEDQLLYTLRQKVRFVVVPMINVWSVSQHTSGIAHSQLRYNGNKVDLNRDFGDLSQAESQNVMNWFKQYADEAVIAMDFHIAETKGISMWFNFINYTDNAVANYKTTNHMYHRYLELGCAQEETDLSHVPGSYTKSDKYIEGRIWNEYGVPTITVEYVSNSNFPLAYSSECMTIAVETYINFVIQNALFYLQTA